MFSMSVVDVMVRMAVLRNALRGPSQAAADAN